MNKNSLKKAALQYHEHTRPGKIEVISTKPCISQRDLSLAYTPGVAEPCLEIEKDASTALKYTAKGNLVAVVSNGTAVLGLGNIGALASKPVMEGKGILFKRFADIDVFDIEVKSTNPDDVIKTVEQISPTFGGINLEDIKAPECFYIEETLKGMLDIPVFHDDQHGTAIISGAALINAVEIAEKKLEDIKVVFSGAGAAGIACANFYISLGVKAQNVLMTDSKGVLWKGRGDEGKNKYKDKFFRATDARTLGDAMVGADAFCGVSAKDILKPEMVKTMAENPIVFAMANPDPEITYPEAIAARSDVIMATGRSDYPNQVNNVLGFPYIFRGTLDVQATDINEEMKRAAAFSLAKLAKEDVPEEVRHVYGDKKLTFGRNYIIPKPFDPRVLVWTSSAVAAAAMRTGVAKKPIDIEEYKEQLRKKTDWSRQVMRNVFIQAKKDPKRIVFPEGTNPKVIWAAAEIATTGIAKPILLGKSKAEIVALFKEHNHSLDGIEVIEPKNAVFKSKLVEDYYKLRQRKGIDKNQANLDMRNYVYFATMMVKKGLADGMVAGVGVNFPEVLRPALQIIGRQKEESVAAGLYLVQHGNEQFFFTDCAVNINPNAQELAEIALLAAKEMEHLGIKPHAALLSFSNFGSVNVPETAKITNALKIINEKRPDLIVDGPVQASMVLDSEMMKKHFPFSKLKTRPNLLVFPNLDAAHISLTMLKNLGNVHSIGPILVGFSKPVHLITRSTRVTNIINLTAIACVDAQKK